MTDKDSAPPAHVVLGKALIEKAREYGLGFSLPVAAQLVKSVTDALLSLPVEQRTEAMGMRRCDLDDVHEALREDMPLWRVAE